MTILLKYFFSDTFTSPYVPTNIGKTTAPSYKGCVIAFLFRIWSYATDQISLVFLTLHSDVTLGTLGYTSSATMTFLHMTPLEVLMTKLKVQHYLLSY